MKKKNLSSYDQIMERKTKIGFSLMLLIFVSLIAYCTLLVFNMIGPAIMCLAIWIYSMIICWNFMNKYSDRILEYLDKKETNSP